jgi:hypothetical protein
MVSSNCRKLLKYIELLSRKSPFCFWEPIWRTPTFRARSFSIMVPSMLWYSYELFPLDFPFEFYIISCLRLYGTQTLPCDPTFHFMILFCSDLQSWNSVLCYIPRPHFLVIYSFETEGIWEQGKSVKLYICNKPWKPVGLWDVEVPTFSRISSHKWRYFLSLTRRPPFTTREDLWY